MGAFKEIMIDTDARYYEIPDRIKMCGSITWVQLLYSMFKNATVKELIIKGGCVK